MEKTKTFPLRYTAYALSIIGFVVSLGLAIALDAGYVFPLIFGAFTALGTYDLLQRRHTVSRNYPISASQECPRQTPFWLPTRNV